MKKTKELAAQTAASTGKGHLHLEFICMPGSKQSMLYSTPGVHISGESSTHSGDTYPHIWTGWRSNKWVTIYCLQLNKLFCFNDEIYLLKKSSFGRISDKSHNFSSIIDKFSEVHIVTVLTVSFHQQLNSTSCITNLRRWTIHLIYSIKIIIS